MFELWRRRLVATDRGPPIRRRLDLPLDQSLYDWCSRREYTIDEADDAGQIAYSRAGATAGLPAVLVCGGLFGWRLPRLARREWPNFVFATNHRPGHTGVWIMEVLRAEEGVSQGRGMKEGESRNAD
jgi:hypothetical protein